MICTATPPQALAMADTSAAWLCVPQPAHIPALDCTPSHSRWTSGEKLPAQQKESGPPSATPGALEGSGPGHLACSPSGAHLASTVLSPVRSHISMCIKKYNFKKQNLRQGWPCVKVSFMLQITNGKSRRMRWMRQDVLSWSQRNTAETPSRGAGVASEAESPMGPGSHRGKRLSGHTSAAAGHPRPRGASQEPAS